ncbi:transcriptional regulator [Bacteroides reticulotermitis JCM 10512]|uniref:Transcriptional regulator n=1 Tax=Bacteroides reticulotermitis JCM 10512 TaxID=1445607 RepID=W4UT68_9BACE|nr:transcriptional regulator [Bacteroides reticulotermitis JCM 10512]
MSPHQLLESWDFPIEIPARALDLELIKRLCDINPTMKLSQSDPMTYDNNPTLIQNIYKNKQRTFCDKVESQGILFQLIARFLKNAKAKIEVSDDRIQKILSHIRREIHEPISISLLADMCCLSKDHFIRLFKKEVGITPHQYINQKKIEKAQLILITDRIPIKNVAYRLAYQDYSYFIRLFKQCTGMTPQEYQNQYRT